MDNIEKTSIKSEEISLKDFLLKINELWRYILSRWRYILIAGVIGSILGLAYAYIKKPIYQATLSFALEDDKPGGSLSSALGLATQFGLDIGGNAAGGEFSGDNLLELMKSRSMVEKALLTPVVINNKKETLAEYYIDFNKFRKEWKGKPGLEGIHFLPNANRLKFTLKQDSLLGVFHKTLIAKNLSVDKIDKKLSIISVRVSSTNELFSKYFAEVLTKNVADFYVQIKQERASKNVAILQHQTDSIRHELNYAFSGVAASIDANPNANPLMQNLHVSSQRKQVDVGTNTAILGELVKNLAIAKMSLLQQTPLIEVIDRPILPLDKEKVGKIKAIILGAIVGMVLAMVYLIMKMVLRKILYD